MTATRYREVTLVGGRHDGHRVSLPWDYLEFRAEDTIESPPLWDRYAPYRPRRVLLTVYRGWSAGCATMQVWQECEVNRA